MLKKTLLFSFFLLSVCFLSAQKEIELPSNNSKVKKVEEILHKIQQASWEYSQDSIAIKMVKDGYIREKVVDYYPNENVIWINEAVYDNIDRLGKEDALAFLIAHEFGHYVLCKQHKQNPDSSGHGNRLLEEEADLMGNLYARLAGYKPCQYTENIFTELYKDFFEEDKKNLYPIQGVRKKIAAEACEKSDTLAKLFFIGNNLLVTQQFESAAVIFDYLAQKFPAYEMYFNAAMARIGYAMSVKNENIYRLPLLLDTRSGLERGADTEADKKMALYLRQVRNILSLAEKKAENPFVCQMYQAYVQYLQQSDVAIQLPPKSTQLNPHILNLYHLLSAIRLSKTDSLQAQMLFEQAKSFYPQEAKWNLKVLHHQKQDSLKAPEYHGILEKETVDGQRVTNLDETPFQYKKCIVSDSLPYQKIWVHITNNPNYIAYCVQNLQSKQRMYGLQTLTGYSAKTQFQVALSDSYSQIQQNYSNRFRIDDGAIQTEYKTLQQNRILQYGNSSYNGILFWFDEKNTLKSWVLYELKADY